MSYSKPCGTTEVFRVRGDLVKFALLKDHLGCSAEKRLEGTGVHAGKPAARLLHQSQQEMTVAPIVVTGEEVRRSR